MTADAPLFHPFLTGDLDWPSATSRTLFLGATAELRRPAELLGAVECVQGFRPDVLKLEQSGASVALAPQDEGFDLALILASRHRGETEARLAQAIQRVKPDGLIVLAGGKTDGVSSLRKRLAKSPGIGGHLAKNHGEVVWLTADTAAQSWAKDITVEQAALPLVEGRYYARPGMFSHDRVDAGSRMLADALPTDLKGAAADFCAGWGYLSVVLAERNPGITSVALYEADHAALQAAQRNMAELAPKVTTQTHWLDLAAEPVDATYDVVVMNPPFHQGRAADPGIGLAMIRAAARATKPGGQLFMVANRGLPYEELLKKAFRGVKQLADDKTFVVWTARR